VVGDRACALLRTAAAERGQQPALLSLRHFFRARLLQGRREDSINFDVFNLFNRKSNDIEYYYASRLNNPIQPEPASGVNDIHFHPVERAPCAWRWSHAIEEAWSLLGDGDQGHGVDQAVGKHEVAVFRDVRVANDVAAAGNRPALELLRLGSKRTTVFGFASDSLYQMTSLIAEMP